MIAYSGILILDENTPTRKWTSSINAGDDSGVNGENSNPTYNEALTIASAN